MRSKGALSGHSRFDIVGVSVLSGVFGVSVFPVLPAFPETRDTVKTGPPGDTENKETPENWKYRNA